VSPDHKKRDNPLHDNHPTQNCHCNDAHIRQGTAYAGFRLTPFLLFKINEHQLALEAAIIEPA
jgi:hypothetical protein